jgi:hypothetical protein
LIFRPGDAMRQPARELRLFLAEVRPSQRKTIEVLRRLVRRSAGQAVETVLWRSLSYHRPEVGGRVKGAVCMITPRADGVQLGFIHGAALCDPEGLLHRSGIAKRFVAFRSSRDIPRKPLSALIAAAARYVPGESRVPGRARDDAHRPAASESSARVDGAAHSRGEADFAP